MRAWNRAKLLWGYLSRRTTLKGLPVEYIVETTAKCNLYCPMCPRETHKQPKEDMTDAIFERLVRESGSTAEHMMLIGLGEPFMDPKIFERIEYCERHNTSTLLSTNGTFLNKGTMLAANGLAGKPSCRPYTTRITIVPMPSSVGSTNHQQEPRVSKRWRDSTCGSTTPEIRIAIAG